MKTTRLFLFLASCVLALAQTADLFDKAPPEVDEALRGRVMLFYQAHISGHYRDAFQVVADDAQDDFLAASKDTYKSCEISKITYSEEFTKASVVTGCKGEYRWRGNHMPVTIPLNSTWKLVDGQWWWYRIKQADKETPWGISRVNPDASGTSEVPSIPPDPTLLAKDILRKVSVDRNELPLKGYEASKGEVHVLNQMPGTVSIVVDRLPLPGMTVKVDHPELASGEKATIVFSYDPKDPSIECQSCVSKQALPTMTANIHIAPTRQAFPIRVTFAVPPEVQKMLPKLPSQ